MTTEYEMLPERPHTCLVQKEAGLPGEFRTMVAKHKYENETVTEIAAALIFPAGNEHIFVQVDVCPFCGEELSTALRHGYVKPDTLRKERAAINAPYYEYRRRYNKAGRSNHPLDYDGWKITKGALTEVERLLIGHAGKHQEYLFTEKQRFCRQLVLPDIRPDRGRIEIVREELPEYGSSDFFN